MFNEKMISEQELKDRIQYWYSKWCNGVTKDEKDIYFSLYKAYQNLQDYWKNMHII